jgi:hypothetical protein
MSPRKILVLTGLVLVLFAFILFFERKLPTTSEADQKKDLVWELPEDQIDSLHLEHPGAPAVDLKKTAPSTWRLTRPDAYPADAAAASGVVSQLASLRRAGSDSAEARPEDYGFGAPTAKATIGWKDPVTPTKRFSRTLEFGVDIPGTEATAARIAGSAHIFFVPASVAAAARKGADDFKTKDVFGGAATDVARVEVERGRGKVSLSRKDGIWWLSQPFVDLADADFSQRFMDELTGLKVIEFLPPADRLNLAALGLAPPLYRVTLSDDKISTSAEFGATRSDGNTVYARRESQLFTVPSTVVEDLSREAVAFRESRLVRFDRAAVTGLEGEFGSEKFALARKGTGWTSGVSNVPAPSADDVMTAVLDLRSQTFLDDAAAAALKARPPAATLTVHAAPAQTWTIQLYPVRGETQALVSGRPGALQLPSDAIDRARAAFQKSLAVPAAPAKK